MFLYINYILIKVKKILGMNEKISLQTPEHYRILRNFCKQCYTYKIDICVHEMQYYEFPEMPQIIHILKEKR